MYTVKQRDITEYSARTGISLSYASKAVIQSYSCITNDACTEFLTASFLTVLYLCEVTS